MTAGHWIALGLGALALWVAAWPRPCEAQTTQTRPAAAQTAQTQPITDVVIQPIKPPDTVDALQTLRSELSEELGRLQPATQPAGSQPTTEPAEVEAARKSATELYAALQALIGEIDLHIPLLKQISDLKDPKAIESFANDLTAMQRQTTELEGQIADPPPFASEADVAKAVSQYEEKNQQLDARTALQTERAKAAADAPQRRQDLADAVQKALTAFQDQIGPLKAQLDAAKTPEDRQQATHQLRLAQLQASMPLFEEAREKLAQQRDAILQSQAERRIPILDALVARLADWKTLLQQIAARGEREQIEARLQFAQRHPESTAPYSLTWWKLRLVELNAREEITKREQQVRSRFPQATAAELQRTLANERAIWTLFMESLERRPSDQVRERYRKVEAAIAQWRAKLAQTRRLLDQSADDQQAVIARIDEYDDQINTLEHALSEQLNDYLLKHPEDTKVQQYTPKHTQAKSQYVEQAQAARTDVTEATKRLQEAADTIAAYLADLQQYRSRLYWRYLFVPERALWAYRPALLQKEWEDERGLRTQTLTSLREVGQSISMAEWALLIAVLAGVEVLALVVRRRMHGYVEAVVAHIEHARSSPEEEQAAIANRLHLFVVRFIGRTAPLAWPILAAALFVKFFELPNLAARLVVAGLALVFVIACSEAVIRALFLPSRPRQRLLRCSNVVAAHYRRWAMVLWTVTVVMVPLPLMAHALDWNYTARVGLWNVYRTVALLMFVVFSARKQLVLRVAGRPEQIRRRWVFGILSTIYWPLWTALLALLGLEIAGYGALVTYIIVGVVETVATIAVAQLVARYVTDLTQRWQSRKPAEEAVAGSGAAPTDRAEPGTEGQNLGLGLAVGLFRWCVAAGAALLILYFWGITAIEVKAALDYEIMAADAAADRPAVTVGRVLAAILSVIIAWWVSRLLRSFLTARVYPAYSTIDRGARAAINTMLHYALVLLGLYFALYALHVPLGALTVVLGTLGLGIGLGLQPVFVNFISGLIILFERHVRIGDLIVVDGELGEVTRVSMRSTAIKTPDGVELVIPNSDLITRNVVNWTLQDSRLRGHVKVGVAYGSDVELVKRLLSDILNQNPRVLRYPPPEVWFMDFGDSSLNFEMVAWFPNASIRWQFITSVRYEINRAFQEHGIEIPFPQSTLSTMGGKPLPIRLVPEDGRPDGRIVHPEAGTAEPKSPPAK